MAVHDSLHTHTHSLLKLELLWALLKYSSKKQTTRETSEKREYFLLSDLKVNAIVMFIGFNHQWKVLSLYSLQEKNVAEWIILRITYTRWIHNL